MNPWKAKLFLDALDERIVPDATPIVTFADAHTSGAVVAAYDNGGSGSGVVTYADRHTSGAVVAAYDNGYTSGSWVSTYSSGAGGGQQQVQISSRDDIIESGKELVAKLNALSLKTLTISVDLDRNQKALEKALERKYDMTLTRAERLVAAFELNALRVKDRELTELLQDTVDAYHVGKHSPCLRHAVQ